MSEETPNQTSRVDALAAIERRNRDQVVKLSAAQLQAERELRQNFRRLIDPGIVRPNSREQAHSSIKILLTLSENLLREPDNPKYQRFKPTNTAIKRNLVDPKGTLEYAIEMGFRPIVEDFQPYYEWDKRHLEKLRIGTIILQEHMQIETEKLERQARAKEEEKAARRANADRVKMAFLDDRLTKEHRDEMEREARQGRESAPPVPLSSRPSRKVKMPGAGVLLSGETAPATESEDDDHGVGDVDTGDVSDPEATDEEDSDRVEAKASTH